MNLLRNEKIDCPYCGEFIDCLIDLEYPDQQYIEDCQVCCRPITFVVQTSIEGDVSIQVYDENTTF